MYSLSSMGVMQQLADPQIYNKGGQKEKTGEKRGKQAKSFHNILINLKGGGEASCAMS